MTTTSHTQLLAEFFGSNDLETVITLQLSNNALAALTIWPYAIDSNLELRNRQIPPGPSSRVQAPQRTHVLVLPTTIDAYDLSRQLILENPLLPSNEPSTRASIEILSLADMTALFAASRVDYRIALCVVIE